MRVWTRVRSLGTGHHFDVSLDRLDVLLTRGAVVELPQHERHFGLPCPPKPRRPKGAGVPNRRRRP